MSNCLFCNKTYKSKKGLRKHYIKCSIANNVNLLNCETELFETMRDLINLNKNLSDRVEKIEKMCNKESRKVDVIGWLNDNRTGNQYIQRFINNIEIEEKDLKMVYELGIIEGIIHILDSKMTEDKPIICFERKSFVLYVRDDMGWKKMSDSEFKKYILCIQRLVLKKFRLDNAMDSLLTDQQNNLYNKRLKRICIENLPIKIKNIKNELYRKNKINIDKIVKYDFVF